MFLALICIAAINIAATPGDKLPESARKYLSKIFPNETVTKVKVDKELSGNTYDAYLSNGAKVEFDKNGVWDEVECKRGLPDVALPERIKGYLTKKHPGVDAIKISRDTRGYEVKLRNGRELKFDLLSNFLRYDD